MRRDAISVIAIPAVILLIAGPLFATRLIPRSFPELVEGADTIFVGRCESVSSHWNKDRTLILTANRFRITRMLKGEPVEEVTLDELGGQVGSIAMRVSDIPQYEKGDELLLCVRRTEAGRLRTFGSLQGRFQIRRDTAGRVWVSSNYYSPQLAVMTPGRRSRQGVPLNIFAERLRAMASERRVQ